MQGFGAQTHLFSEVTGPQQFERTKKKCPMDLRKLLTPFLLTPLQRDFYTMLMYAFFFPSLRLNRVHVFAPIPIYRSDLQNP